MPSSVSRVVSATGSSSSHVAILVRGMGVPAVMGVTDLPAGRMSVGTSSSMVTAGGLCLAGPLRATGGSAAGPGGTGTVAGTDVSGPAGGDTRWLSVAVVSQDQPVSEMSFLGIDESEGVGLYRTELPFMIRDRFPGERRKARIIATFWKLSPHAPVTRVPSISAAINRCFPVDGRIRFWVGVAAVSPSIHPQIFLTQIRAMLGAAAGLNNLQIMLPMISPVSEVDELLLLIQRGPDELAEEGQEVVMPQLSGVIFRSSRRGLSDRRAGATGDCSRSAAWPDPVSAGGG